MHKLKLTNLANAPFAAYIEEQIKKHLEPLTSSVLEIDFSGKARDAIYEMDFDTNSYWKEPVNKHRCWYYPGLLGETQVVWVQAHQRMNYCTNVDICSTCTPAFRNSKNELGQAIANTALHELGHQFGLLNKTAFPGADDAGHTGDERNYMFDPVRHKDYTPILTDARRTTKYTVKEGDNLSVIAYRLGFRRWSPLAPAWKLLYEFKGQDGRSNQQLLRSGDPNKIFPGEEVWIPDYDLRARWRREVEVAPKAFTKAQYDAMKQFVKEGRQFTQ